MFALYLAALAVGSVIIHEAAHIIAALLQGIPFSQLNIGFWGINPSVTLPPGLESSVKSTIMYSGGITSGAVLVVVYLAYWVRKYRRQPSLLAWVMGMATIVLAATQFSFGHLEGRYHSAYLSGAGTLFSPVHLLTLGWAVSAVLMHCVICPKKMIVGPE